MSDRTSVHASAFIERMNSQFSGLLNQEAKDDAEISALADLFLIGDIDAINTLLSLRFFEVIRPLRLPFLKEEDLYVVFGKDPFDVKICVLGSDILFPSIDLPKEEDLKVELSWTRIVQKNKKLSIDDIIKERVVFALFSINRISSILKRRFVLYREVSLSENGRALYKGLSFVVWIETSRAIKREKILRAQHAPLCILAECRREIERLRNITKVLEQRKFQ
ncbi:MAG: hypothetical protein K9L31_00500 [Candidatus Pacebacteria bacterium]|nr:hypothetical protein [Candidatus Paceibacterota bacterium]